MIQPNELRIGNYFNTPLNDIFKVEELKTNFIIGKSDNGFCNTTYEDIEPIELTQRIIDSLGGLHELDCMCGISSNYGDDKTCYFPFDGDIIGEEIRYLHELQNFHFAIHRKELEVKL